MSYDPPRLIGSASSSAAEVSLQTNTQFEFSISDPNDIPANAEVALIVGSDPGSPDITGPMRLAGTYDEKEDEVVKLPNLRLTLTSEALKKYVGTTVTIRYRVRGESGDTYSEPLELKVRS